MKTIALLSRSAFCEVFCDWLHTDAPAREGLVPRDSWEGNGSLYVAFSRTERTFKIGMSRDPFRRLRDMNSSGTWGVDMELVAAVTDIGPKFETAVISALSFARSDNHRSCEVFRADALGELVALLRARADASLIQKKLTRAGGLCRLCGEPGHNFQSCARKSNSLAYRAQVERLSLSRLAKRKGAR